MKTCRNESHKEGVKGSPRRNEPISIVPVGMLAGLPYHAPHREAWIRRTAKVLDALMVEAQLVKELSVISSTSQQSKHRRWEDMARPSRVVTTWAEFQIPFLWVV